MLSAEMISPEKRRASSMASRDFPDPVAPRITKIGTRDIDTSLQSTIVSAILGACAVFRRERPHDSLCRAGAGNWWNADRALDFKTVGKRERR